MNTWNMTQCYMVYLVCLNTSQTNSVLDAEMKVISTFSSSLVVFERNRVLVVVEFEI